MANSGRGGAGWFMAAGLLVAAVAGGYVAYRAARGPNTAITYHPATAPSTRPAEDAATRPASQPAKPPRGPTTTFIDVIRATFPRYTTTQPLVTPVGDLFDGARVVLDDPVYLAINRPDLWITRTDGLPMPQALGRAMDAREFPQVHVVPERVRFVHWTLVRGRWTPYLVCDRAGGGGGFDVVSPARRDPIPDTTRAYDWSRANSWDDKLVVPSDAGVSIFRVEPALTEEYQALVTPAAAPATVPTTASAEASRPKPQSLLDWQGLLAWVPSEDGRSGSRGAARYVKDKWTLLGPQQGWPEQILHLVPLLDGSVLQVIANPDGGVRTAIASLDAVPIDEPAVVTLVQQMSDPDADRRDAAFKELSRFGPGVYGLLERLAAEQPPEARARLRALMRNQTLPTLGGMTLLGGRLQTVTRHADGGAVFYAEGGVSIPREEGPAVRRVPAWIAVRPGRVARVLEEMFVNELKPDECEILTAGRDEWVVTGDAAGPRRWVGNGFVPLLRKDEAAFSHLVGIDQRGRWLFRKPGTDAPTLILDPTIPDPTPRLPVWEYANAQDFGWTADNWPAVKRPGGIWSLREDGWKLLDESKGHKLLTELPKPPPTTGPSTSPFIVLKSGDLTSEVIVMPSTQPTDGRRYQGTDVDPPLLVDEDGTTYDDGVQSLRVVKKDGTAIVWPLPPAATGKGTPTLLRTKSGLLFLFNQPGRVLRIRPTPDEPEPFTVEATFTKRVPSVERRRIWLDPAGRIVIADARRLVLFFPDGYIPPALRDLMLINRTDYEQ